MSKFYYGITFEYTFFSFVASQEGWIHHVCRTAVACFLTRGDLWISWEDGLEVKYKLQASNWSVNGVESELDSMSPESQALVFTYDDPN